MASSIHLIDDYFYAPDLGQMKHAPLTKYCFPLTALHQMSGPVLVKGGASLLFIEGIAQKLAEHAQAAANVTASMGPSTLTMPELYSSAVLCPLQVEDLVMVLDEQLRAKAAQIAQRLRKAGRRVDLVLESKKMKWVFKVCSPLLTQSHAVIL